MPQQPPPATSKLATPPDRIENTLKPITKAKWGYEQARHLLWRAGFGGDESQIRWLVQLGPEKAVDALIETEKVPDEAVKDDQFDKSIMRAPTEEERQMLRRAQQTQDEDTLAKIRLERQRREREDRLQMNEVQKWWLRRMIETPRPLEERLTLFWHGLLATSFRTIENSYHMFLQNQMFRKNALGSYSALLTALIRDPAMLAYLNNNDSRRNKPNENLAREIMELFSLGIGNYSEDDIKNGARALTGYTFQDDEFTFQKNNHDTGTKTILGQTGTWTGDDFVRIILEQPACARYITRKLYHHFVADVPPDERGGDAELDPAQRAVLRQLAEVLRTSRYSVKAVMRRLLLSEHFYEPHFMNDQIKSPVVLVVGAVRSLKTPVRDLSILNDALDLMGQKIFYPPSVKGWDGGRSWINTSTYFVRQNVMAFLIAGKKPQGYDATADTQKYDAKALLAPYEADTGVGKGEPGACAEALLRLTLGWVPEEPKKALVAFAAANGNTMSNEVLTGMLLLISTMPEYQMC